MHKGSIMRRGVFSVALVVALSLPGCGRGDAIRAPASFPLQLVHVPEGPFRAGSPEGRATEGRHDASVRAFWLGAREVTVAEFAAYLNDGKPRTAWSFPQMRVVNGLFTPLPGTASRPITHVNRADADAYCRWLQQRTGRRVRLPTEEEWERAARGGIDQARYPWGWGEPEGRACFDAEGPRVVGTYQPNPYGLYDMAGNVYEWCASRPGVERAYARGGSWAERLPSTLTVFHRTAFPVEYRDADVGFRVLVEPD